MDPGLAEIVAPTLASLGTWSLRRAICDVRRTLAPRLHLSPPHMCGREPELVQQAIASNWIAPAGPGEPAPGTWTRRSSRRPSPAGVRS